MVQCSVFGCYSASHNQRKGNIKLYSFPKDVTLQKQWLHKTGRKVNFNVTNAKVCSLHFSEKQIKRDLRFELADWMPSINTRNLKTNAVPDILLPNLYHGSAGTDRKKRLESKAKSKPITKQSVFSQNGMVCKASAKSGLIRAVDSKSEVVLPVTAEKTTMRFLAMPLEPVLSQLQEQPKEIACLASGNNTAPLLSAVKDDSCTSDGTGVLQPMAMSDLEMNVKYELEDAEMPLEVCLKIKPEVVDESFESKEYATSIIENVVVKEEDALVEDGNVKNEFDASIVTDRRVLPNEDGSTPCQIQEKLIKSEIKNDGNLLNCLLDLFDGVQEESHPSTVLSDGSILSKNERENGTSVAASSTGLGLLYSECNSKAAVLALSKSFYRLVPYVSLTRLPSNIVHHYCEGSQAKRMKVSRDGDDDGAESVYVRGPGKVTKNTVKNKLKRQVTARNSSKVKGNGRTEATDKGKLPKKKRYNKNSAHLQRRTRKVPLPGYVPCGCSVQREEPAGDDSFKQCVTVDAPKKSLNKPSKRKRKIFAGFDNESCCVSDDEVVIEKQLMGAAAVEKQVLDDIASLLLPHSIFDSESEDTNTLPGHIKACSLCKYTTRAPLAMQYHMKMHAVDEGTLSFCAQCAYITNNEEFLCLHFEVHNFNRRMANDNGGVDAPCNKLKLCCFCDFVNYDEESMNIHAFQEHPRADFKLIFRYERFYSNSSQKFAWRYKGDDPVLLLYPPLKDTERCSGFKNVSSKFNGYQGLANASETTNALTISNGDKEEFRENTKLLPVPIPSRFKLKRRVFTTALELIDAPTAEGTSASSLLVVNGDKEEFRENTKLLPVPIHSRFKPKRRVFTTALKFIDANAAEETSASSLLVVNLLNSINSTNLSATSSAKNVQENTEVEATSVSAATLPEVSAEISKPLTNSKPKLNVLSRSTPARLPPFCSLSDLSVLNSPPSPEDADVFAATTRTSFGNNELEITRSPLKNSKLLPLPSISPPFVDRDVTAFTEVFSGAGSSHGKLTDTRAVPFSNVNKDGVPEVMTSLSPRVNRDCCERNENRRVIANTDDVLSVKTDVSSLPLTASSGSSTGGLPASFTGRSPIGLKKVTNNALSEGVTKDNNDDDIIEADYPRAINDSIEDDAFSNGPSLTSKKTPEIAEFSLRVNNGSISDCKTIKLKKIIVPSENIIKFLKK